jgi:hypothetical protein
MPPRSCGPAVARTACLGPTEPLFSNVARLLLKDEPAVGLHEVGGIFLPPGSGFRVRRFQNLYRDERVYNVTLGSPNSPSYQR